MSKAPASWSLRFKSPVDYPNIAKCSDELDFAQAEKPVSMYFKEEDLKDDEAALVEKDAEYYRRKRERRRAYRKKSTLVLEDSSVQSGESTGFRFEGRMVSLGLADVEDAKSKQAKVEEAPFRYVLLQFIKKDADQAGGAASNEINVIPVCDLFALKKASLVPDELLVDIDERFIQEIQRSKGSISRYKGINKSLTAAERNRLGLKNDEDGDGRQAGLNAKEFLGGFGSTSLFGAAVNKAFGGANKGSKNTSSSAGNGSFLNENGMDMDELSAQENLNQGDYSTRFVDDEEEYVAVEQNRNQAMAESELSTSQRYAVDHDEEAEDSAEDSDAEEGSAAARGGEEEVGMVDDSMVTNAAEARKLFMTRGTNNKPVNGANTKTATFATNAPLTAPITTASASAGSGSAATTTNGGAAAGASVKSALKRPRDEAFGAETAAVSAVGAGGLGVSGKVASSGDLRGRVSFEEAGAGATAGQAGVTPTPSTTTSTSTPTATTSATATAAAATAEYPLTEQGFRQFLRNRGGKVPPADMNFFKPQLRACDKAVRKKFLDMVLSLTVEVEDPLLGKVLTLK